MYIRTELSCVTNQVVLIYFGKWWIWFYPLCFHKCFPEKLFVCSRWLLWLPYFFMRKILIKFSCIYIVKIVQGWSTYVTVVALFCLVSHFTTLNTRIRKYVFLILREIISVKSCVSPNDLSLIIKSVTRGI